MHLVTSKFSEAFSIDLTPNMSLMLPFNPLGNFSGNIALKLGAL